MFLYKKFGSHFRQARICVEMINYKTAVILTTVFVFRNNLTLIYLKQKSHDAEKIQLVLVILHF